jgi:hypothetical protein
MCGASRSHTKVRCQHLAKFIDVSFSHLFLDSNAKFYVRNYHLTTLPQAGASDFTQSVPVPSTSHQSSPSINGNLLTNPVFRIGSLMLCWCTCVALLLAQGPCTLKFYYENTHPFLWTAQRTQGLYRFSTLSVTR